MDFTIPCSVVARFANLIKNKSEICDEWSDVIRIENGIAVASNRRILAAELIGGSSGVVHLKADPVLIAQCAVEATYDSILTITVNEPLKYAVCKTTMGYNSPSNCVEWSTRENYLDKWRSIVPKMPAVAPKGGMFWQAELIADLARSSPSGRVIFEEVIDVTRPTIIRDAIDPNWFGLFLGGGPDEAIPVPATLPDWMI